MPGHYERLGPESVLDLGGKTGVAIFIFMLIAFVAESELAQVSSSEMKPLDATYHLLSMYNQA